MNDIDTHKEDIIPIWEKYNLTIKEASQYFNIGENKLREMIQQSECDFVLYVGKKALIKKTALEKYLASIKYI